MTTQPKPYDQARKEAFEDYSANTPGQTEYMKIDFDAGFSAGYNAALRGHERELRERAAIAAIQGMLAHGTSSCSGGFITRKAIGIADALVEELNNQQS